MNSLFETRYIDKIVINIENLMFICRKTLKYIQKFQESFYNWYIYKAQKPGLKQKILFFSNKYI